MKSGKTLNPLFPLIFAACSGEAPSAPRPRPPPLVVVEKVAVRDVDVEVSSPVELRPWVQADVVSKVVGYLDTVRVERGDRVKAGQLLATVRPGELSDLVTSTEGGVAQAKAAVALAKANFERVEALAPTGRVSRAELDSARAALAQAEAQQSGLRAQSSAAGKRLKETSIVAPFDGVVTVRRLDPGALVGPGTNAGAILTVARVDGLRALMTLTERDARAVREGIAAHVLFDAHPGRPFDGKVARLAPAFDPVTRTLEVEVRLPNREGELRPGMYGRGAIVTETHPGAVTVPVSAVQIVQDQRFVYVLDGEKVHRTRVETGFDGENWFEVTRGLDPSAEVVIAGADALADGMNVRVSRGVNPFTGASAATTPPTVPAK